MVRVVAIIDEACSFLSFSRAFDTALSVCYTYFTGFFPEIMDKRGIIMNYNLQRNERSPEIFVSMRQRRVIH